MDLEWKPYLNDRLIAEHPDGFFVIKPVELEESQPIFCPTCSATMNSIYDDDSWKKFKCCDSCSNAFVYPNLERWKQGWRPNTDEINHQLKKKSPI